MQDIYFNKKARELEGEGRRLPFGAKVATVIAMLIAVPLAANITDRRYEAQVSDYQSNTHQTNIVMKTGETLDNMQLRLLGREYFDRVDNNIIHTTFARDNNLPRRFDPRKLQAHQRYTFRARK